MPSSNVASGACYALTFGNLSDGTTYQNPYGLDYSAKTIDMRNQTDGLLAKAFHAGIEKYEAKAQTISGQSALTGISAGLPTVPVFLDPRIIDITRKWTPAVELIPRQTCTSNVYSYVRITNKGGAYAAVEDAPLAETSTTYARQSVAIKYLYSVGRVSGPVLAAQPSFILEGLTSSGERGPFGNQNAPNAKQQEVLVKVRELRELEESLIMNGDATTTPAEFDGIVKLMSTTNSVDLAGGALSLDNINASIQKAFDAGGRPSLAFCSSGVFTALLNLINSKTVLNDVGMLSRGAVFWGYETIIIHTMVGAIPIIPSMYLSNGAGTKRIYFLDMSVVHMAVLQDMVYQDMAIVNDTQKFFMKIYEALVIRAPTFCSSILNIA